MSLREAAESAGDPAYFSTFHRVLEIPDDKHLGTFWKAAPVLGQGADALTTIVVIHKLKGGAVEGNPVMAPFLNKGVLGQVAFVGLKLGVGAGFAFAGAKIAQSGHSTTAKVFSGLASGLGFGAAIHNVRMLR